MNAPAADSPPRYVHSLSGAVENENRPSRANRHSFHSDHVLRPADRVLAWNSTVSVLKPGHAKMPFMKRQRSGIWLITSTILRSSRRKSPALAGISTLVIRR